MRSAGSALLSCLLGAAFLVPLANSESAACGRTRDVVVELSFESIDENGNPTIRTIRRVQQASRGHYGTRCDRRAQRNAEERACIRGITDVARRIGAGDGAEAIACRDLSQREPEQAQSFQSRGAYRLAGVSLSCGLRYQRLHNPPQLALALEPSGRNFECDGGNVREVGTLEERCEGFATLAQTMLALAAEASCPIPVEVADADGAASDLDAAAAAAAAEGEGGDGDYYNYCLSAGVSAAQARFDAQKAALQRCVIDPPIAALPVEDAEAGVPIDDELAGTGAVDPFFEPPAGELAADAEAGDGAEGADTLPDTGDPSLAGTGAVDPFFEPEVAETDAEDGEAELGADGEPLTGDASLAGTGAVDPFFAPEEAAEGEPELAEDGGVADTGDPALAGTGAVDPFFDPDAEAAAAAGADGETDLAAADVGAAGQPIAVTPPRNACEADETRSRFIERVAGGLGCTGLTSVPQGLEGDDSCGARFSALKDQYYALQLEQVSACIADLRL